MSLNIIAVVGRLGADPEFKMTPSGVPVATFRIAVNRTKKGEADWFRVECWRQTAEFVRDHLVKGREVSVSGRMENRQYEKDGEKRDAWQITAQDVQFVGPKPSGQAGDDYDQGQPSPPPAHRAPPPAAKDEIPF